MDKQGKILEDMNAEELRARLVEIEKEKLALEELLESHIRFIRTVEPHFEVDKKISVLKFVRKQRR